MNHWVILHRFNTEYLLEKISYNINVILTVTSWKLTKIFLTKVCEWFNDSDHFKSQKKPFHCLQCTCRIPVSGDIQQVFKESIDYVDWSLRNVCIKYGTNGDIGYCTKKLGIPNCHSNRKSAILIQSSHFTPILFHFHASYFNELLQIEHRRLPSHSVLSSDLEYEK